jgi:SAM-dependent methyltransferase
MMRWRRYRTGSWAYDVLSAEWPVYRAGRLAGIGALRPRPGGTVLDVGCGTGLNLPLLRAAVGPGGRVVGLDASPAMLRQARGKIIRAGWDNVDLIHADATTVDPALIARHAGGGSRGYVDAILFTYTLSIMSEPEAAWRNAVATTGPGTRVAVVDLALPTGMAAVFAPLARLACAMGGSNVRAEPWRLVEEHAIDVEAYRLRGGHIRVAAGALV